MTKLDYFLYIVYLNYLKIDFENVELNPRK